MIFLVMVSTWSVALARAATDDVTLAAGSCRAEFGGVVVQSCSPECC